MGVHDLNCGWRVCDARGLDRPGVTHERWKDAVRAGHGVCAVEVLRAHHRAAQGRCGCAHAGLRGSVSPHGLRADHLARVAARHRGLPGGQPSQAFPHGAEGAAGSLDAGRRAEPARLAYLPRAGSAADRPRQGAVCPRAFGAGARCERLRARFHRFLRSEPLPLLLGQRCGGLLHRSSDKGIESVLRLARDLR